MPRTLLVALLALALAPLPAVTASGAGSDGASIARVGEEIVLRTDLVERRWDARALRTIEIRDLRTAFHLRGPHPDFALVLDGARVPSDLLDQTGLRLVDRGSTVEVTWYLVLPGVLTVERTVSATAGIAGFRSTTSLQAFTALALSGYTIDELPAGERATPTLHAFRAGADWRETDWEPGLSVGDAHTGDWHVTTTGARGEPIDGPGEYLSLAYPEGEQVALVAERRDYASSRLRYDGTSAATEVDLARDLVYTGPFEEDVHAENSDGGVGRHRALGPGDRVDLEPGFVALGEDADDEPWQFHRHLRRLRPGTTDLRVIFNTDKVDDNRISTGVKDDVDFERFLSLASAAREMGVDTFVFDDGWQARSGDWCADSPGCRDARNEPGLYSRSLDPDARRYPDRFPDPDFTAVREVLANQTPDPADDIRLGLWMTPMEFHPASRAYTTNPQWACAPVGDATAAASILDPDGGSNEAGIGVWNPLALGVHPDDGRPLRLVDYIEERVRRAIDVYGSTYFKFDFLVWVDCGGVQPVDMYGYRDAFVAMLDRLVADYPSVTFTIDETNDYRMFPYESVTRGATWFQNGTPDVSRQLFNVWNLGPYVPGYTIGQAALGNRNDREQKGVDAAMAAALGSHLTFWLDIDTELSAAERAQVKRWTDFYRANAELLAGVTYPLLSDPRERTWTALQRWDRDEQRGLLLAYRQEGAEDARAIALRGLRPGTLRATLVDPATGAETEIGTFDAETLRTTGLPVAIASAWGYAIVRLEPA